MSVGPQMGRAGVDGAMAVVQAALNVQRFTSVMCNSSVFPFPGYTGLYCVDPSGAMNSTT